MNTEKLKKKLGKPKRRKPIAPPTIAFKVRKKEKIEKDYEKELDIRDLSS
jgi:hypothetical protein